MPNPEWLKQCKSEFFRNFTDECDKENDYYDSQFEEGRPSRVWDWIEGLVSRRDAEILAKVEGLKIEEMEDYDEDYQCKFCGWSDLDCGCEAKNEALDEVTKIIKGE
jgi:hypothetical protein